MIQAIAYMSGLILKSFREEEVEYRMACALKTSDEGYPIAWQVVRLGILGKVLPT